MWECVAAVVGQGRGTAEGCRQKLLQSRHFGQCHLSWSVCKPRQLALSRVPRLEQLLQDTCAVPLFFLCWCLAIGPDFVPCHVEGPVLCLRRLHLDGEGGEDNNCDQTILYNPNHSMWNQLSALSEPLATSFVMLCCGVVSTLSAPGFGVCKHDWQMTISKQQGTIKYLLSVRRLYHLMPPRSDGRQL